jgi:hypothetical protein
MEAGLAVLITCACLKVIHSPCTIKVSFGTASASLAVARPESEDASSIQLLGSMDGIPAESVHSTTTIRWWQPMTFSMYMKLTILMLPLAIGALLEARYQVS